MDRHLTDPNDDPAVAEAAEEYRLEIGTGYASLRFRPPVGPHPWQRGGTGRSSTTPFSAHMADRYSRPPVSGDIPMEFHDLSDRSAG